MSLVIGVKLTQGTGKGICRWKINIFSIFRVFFQLFAYDLTIFLNFLFLQNVKLSTFIFLNSNSLLFSHNALNIFFKGLFKLNVFNSVVKLQRHSLFTFSSKYLNPSYFNTVVDRLTIGNQKHSYLNNFFFYKTALNMYNILYTQLLNDMYFFIFSETNIMKNFYNILKYSSSYKNHVDFETILGFTKRQANYYHLHSALHILHYNYKVYSLVILDGFFTKYNLHAFRSTQFILIGVSDALKNYNGNFDYVFFVRNLTPSVSYALALEFSSLYFSFFFTLKWRFFVKYTILYKKHQAFLIS